jgi:hypothetical protein
LDIGSSAPTEAADPTSLNRRPDPAQPSGTPAAALRRKKPDWMERIVEAEVRVFLKTTRKKRAKELRELVAREVRKALKTALR